MPNFNQSCSLCGAFHTPIPCRGVGKKEKIDLHHGNGNANQNATSSQDARQPKGGQDKSKIETNSTPAQAAQPAQRPPNFVYGPQIASVDFAQAYEPYANQFDQEDYNVEGFYDATSLQMEDPNAFYTFYNQQE